MNKKILWILNENLLYIKRENILLIPIWLILFSVIAYILWFSSLTIMDFAKSSYVTTISNIQYVILLITTIFLTFSSFEKDFSTKNIYILLQKVKKEEYYLWKLLSIILSIILVNLSSLIIFKLGYMYLFNEVNFSLFYIYWFQTVELILVAFISIILFFTIKKTLAKFFSVLIIILMWSMIPQIKNLISKGVLDINWLAEKVINTLYYMTPNFKAFNVRDVIMINTDIFNNLLISTIYWLSLMWIVFVLTLHIFNKKDF